jgi:predicted glycoside hydrolase/deacetylase ChbG (UPF0249 family)
VARWVIFNADDFGASTGINRGILECHHYGVVTSASLMVTGRAVHEAVELSRPCPDLAVGLHWDVCGEDERDFDLTNPAAVRDEWHRQLERFHQLLGRNPTHVDSHRHVHRQEPVAKLFQELVAPLNVPLRGDGRIHFVGGFYAQWQWKTTELEYVSVPFLEELLRAEVGEGWIEVSCHPGYRSPDFTSVYLLEREVEVRTLTDPRVRATLGQLGIRLASYADYTAACRGLLPQQHQHEDGDSRTWANA